MVRVFLVIVMFYTSSAFACDSHAKNEASSLYPTTPKARLFQYQDGSSHQSEAITASTDKSVKKAKKESKKSEQ